MASSLARRAALACVLLFPLVSIAAFADAKTYDESLTIPADASPDLKAVADDALQTLQTMTGRDFHLATAADAGGIRLLRPADAPAAIAKQLAPKDSETFYIGADATKVRIVANSDSGLTYGLYYYLQQLGARWFLPGDNWTVIPHRDDLRLTLDKLVEPAFSARTYFGTGGLGRAGVNRPYDLADNVPKMWAKWQLRNGFGAQYSINGHAGEEFNTRNKAELLAHPEYLAEVNGAHVPWSVTAKLDVSNPGLVQLYVNDRLQKFAQQLATWPGLFAVSVEPADGGGYCNSGPCTKIGDGSASDQTYYLANQVAKAVAAKWPGKHVSLFAYADHLLPPSFDLEPNVYVSVTPYGFNYTGLSAEEIIAAWGRKLAGRTALAPHEPRLGIYDYWAIPDWALDLPSFNFRTEPAAKVRYWHDHGITGLVGESSYSAGAVGLGWYLGLHLLWDPTTNTDAMLADFYTKAFGPAAPPMKRMLERWSGGFLMTDHELGLSFRDWTEARRLAAGNEPVMARLDDYGRYLHYMRLWYEMRINGSKSTATGPGGPAQALLAYMWNIYDSGMIEPFRMTQLILAHYARTPENLSLYNLADKNAAGWKSIHQLTRAEIDALLVEDTATYKPLDYESRGYGGETVLLPAALAPRPAAPKPIGMYFYGPTDFDLLVPEGMHSADFTVATGHGENMPVKLTDAEGKTVFEAEVPPMSGRTLTLPFTKPGRYTLSTRASHVLYSAQIPPGLGFTVHSFLNSQGFPAPRLYFYIPKGLKNLAFYLEYNLVPHVYDGDGHEVQPRVKTAPGISIYDVPPGQDGKVWSFGDLRVPRPIYLLNAPAAFAVSPDQLLVPQDALKAPPL